MARRAKRRGFRRLLGQRDFLPSEEIGRSIELSKNFDPQAEDATTASTLLFFETAKQHTWLVATPRRLYCILDDARKPAPHINWSLHRDRVIEAGDVVLEIRTTTPDERERTGLVDFGPNHKGWLYSTGLFARQTLGEAVVELIRGTMLGAGIPMGISEKVEALKAWLSDRMSAEVDTHFEFKATTYWFRILVDVRPQPVLCVSLRAFEDHAVEKISNDLERQQVPGMLLADPAQRLLYKTSGEVERYDPP